MKTFGSSSGGGDEWELDAAVIRVRIAQAEDRATLRSDLSAALGPKSKADGWKRFQPLAF
jgi:hypothetical protein